MTETLGKNELDFFQFLKFLLWDSAVGKLWGSHSDIEPLCGWGESGAHLTPDSPSEDKAAKKEGRDSCRLKRGVL